MTQKIVKSTLFISLLFFVVHFLSSCTSSVLLTIMKPADVTVKQHIKQVALINRTKPSNTVMNVIEGVMTGEGIYQDAEASQEVINGLNLVLKDSPRFHVISTGLRLKGSKTGNTFTNPLSWSQIEQYCKQYNADAVVSLEVFDTDFIVTDGSIVETKKDENGNEYKETVFTAKGVASVKAGFRFYDPKTKAIIDQNLYNRSRTFKSKGASVKDAIAKLIKRNAAVKRVGFVMGKHYGFKIAPRRVTVKRKMYKKAKHSTDVEKGKRYADVNDWKNAAKAWERAVTSPHEETAGKAAYNLAVAFEVLGDLEKAINWARAAYTEYGNKDAKGYQRILEHRVQQEMRLKEQMGTE